MSEDMDVSNFDYIKPSDEVKFVITDRTDYEWSKDIIRKYNLKPRCQILFLLPLECLHLNYLLNGCLKTGLMSG